jgi:predicted GNAT family N-acyltransferase
VGPQHRALVDFERDAWRIPAGSRQATAPARGLDGGEMGLEILRLEASDQRWADALALRRAILRTPLGLDFSTDDLAAESGDTLFAAVSDGTIVGVVMLRPSGANSVKLRQMAVLDSMRGKRVGQQLLAAFESYAQARGIRHVGLAARTTAIGFYERMGYVVDGDEFTEVTIPHRHMSKTL